MILVLTDSPHRPHRQLSSDLLPTALHAAKIANIDQERVFVIGQHDHDPAHNRASSFSALLKDSTSSSFTVMIIVFFSDE